MGPSQEKEGGGTERGGEHLNKDLGTAAGMRFRKVEMEHDHYHKFMISSLQRCVELTRTRAQEGEEGCNVYTRHTIAIKMSILHNLFIKVPELDISSPKTDVFDMLIPPNTDYVKFKTF
eukprot:1161401-Pelagomonas_calceolata.AAC.22